MPVLCVGSQGCDCRRVRVTRGFPGGTVVKNPPATAGDTGHLGLILGQKGPLEKEMTTHSNILAWEIPWTEGPGGLQSMTSQKS